MKAEERVNADITQSEGTERTWFQKILHDIANGVMVVEEIEDNNLISFRRETCNNCNLRDRPADMCKVCGCFLDLKVKSKTNRTKSGSIVVTHCPMGFWNDLEIANFYNDKTKK